MHRIKRRPAYILILLAFFIQILLGNFFGSSAMKPNIMIIITTFFALFTNEKFGCEAGAVSGMLLDIFSIRLFGLNTLLFALGGYIVGRYNTKFYRDSIITHLIITFAMSLFILSSLLLFLNLRNSFSLPRLGPNMIFTPSILASSLLNAFLGIWIYAFLCRIFRLSECEL